VLIAAKALPETPSQPQAPFDGAGFLTVAGGSATVLYAIACAKGSDNAIVNVLWAIIGTTCLFAFVAIESAKLRQGHEPLFDLGSCFSFLSTSKGCGSGPLFIRG
jgi:hypothetical protein